MSGDRFLRAISLHRAGRLDEAGRLYARIVAFEPRHAGALHMLGVLRMGEERFEEAEALLARSVAADPTAAPAHANLGTARLALRRVEGAERSLREAIRLDPAHAQAQLNLSGLLLARGRPQEAFEAARRASELRPELAAPYCNAGVALRAGGHPARAEAAFEAALARDPAHAESLHGYGNLLRARGDRDEEALALLERARAADPARIETLVAIARLASDRGDPERAGATLEAARTRSPDDPLLRVALAMSALVAFHDRADGPARMREAHLERVSELAGWARDGGPDRLRGLADAIGFAQPFHLPYAGGPRDGEAPLEREAQRIQGALFADAAALRWRPPPPAAPPAPGERIRVGFVSGYMRDHSNWKVPLRGWMEGLDPDRFTVLGYHTGEVADADTARARAACARFVQGPLDTGRWIEAIAADRPHALVWPETGMDGAAFRLACLRLAPLQCVSWGHPITSGLPTMDLFLSSDAMEPAGAERHYTERLVRLPGLGFDWEPIDPAREGDAGRGAARDRLGLPRDAVLMLCGQALPKYLPGSDALLVRIARAVPEAVFAFVEPHRGRRLLDRMRARLGSAFRRAGLDPEARLRFLDRLAQAEFVALCGDADLILDGTDWSGCNSTLEGLPTGTPVVTLEGDLMRRRHSGAILRAIGVTGTIAADEDGYVRIATALARDPSARNALRGAIRNGAAGLAASRRAAADLGEVLARHFG